MQRTVPHDLPVPVAARARVHAVATCRCAPSCSPSRATPLARGRLLRVIRARGIFPLHAQDSTPCGMRPVSIVARDGMHHARGTRRESAHPSARAGQCSASSRPAAPRDNTRAFVRLVVRVDEGAFGRFASLRSRVEQAGSEERGGWMRRAVGSWCFNAASVRLLASMQSAAAGWNSLQLRRCGVTLRVKRCLEASSCFASSLQGHRRRPDAMEMQDALVPDVGFDLDKAQVIRVTSLASKGRARSAKRCR